MSHVWTAAGVRRRATSRRSVGVSGSAGGSTGSVRGSGRRAEVGNEFGRRPGVAAVRVDEAALRIDDGGAKVVRDVDGVLRVVLDVDDRTAMRTR